MALVKKISEIHDSFSDQGGQKLLDYITEEFKVVTASDLEFAKKFLQVTENKNLDSKNLIKYVSNSNKTERNLKTYLKGINTFDDKDLALSDMQRARKKYLNYHGKDIDSLGKKSIFVRHWVHSYDKESTDNIDWDLLHETSIKLAKEMCGENYIGFVASHLPKNMDDENLGMKDFNDKFHTHIIICSYPNDPTLNKLKNDDGQWKEYVNISNKYCKEIGANVIDLSNYEKNKTSKCKTRIESSLGKKNLSWKKKMKEEIEQIKKGSKNYDDFISNIKKNGYKVRAKPNSITYRKIFLKKERAIRGSKLSDELTVEGLKEYFANKNRSDKKSLKSETLKTKNKILINDLLKKQLSNDQKTNRELNYLLEYDDRKYFCISQDIDLNQKIEELIKIDEQYKQELEYLTSNYKEIFDEEVDLNEEFEKIVEEDELYKKELDYLIQIDEKKYEDNFNRLGFKVNKYSYDEKKYSDEQINIEILTESEKRRLRKNDFKQSDFIKSLEESLFNSVTYNIKNSEEISEQLDNLNRKKYILKLEIEKIKENNEDYFLNPNLMKFIKNYEKNIEFIEKQISEISTLKKNFDYSKSEIKFIRSNILKEFRNRRFKNKQKEKKFE